MKEISKTLLSQLSARESFAFSSVEGGIPRGSLISVSGSAGSGKTEVILNFLAENPKLKVAWVEERFTIYPCAFLQARVNLDRVLFVNADHDAKKALWVVHQILKSQIFEVVILSTGSAASLDAVTLRRLQISAEKANATLIFLSDFSSLTGAWSIPLQIQVSRSLESQNPILHIIKSRGQKVCQTPLRQKA